MCGIAGIVGGGDDREAIAERLGAMCDAMRHRGPDDRGVVACDDHAAGLAAVRLSIIDPEHGGQPIANEDGSIHVALNGEIYNHGELRRRLEQRAHRFKTRCDTEVIVHLYEEYGDDCVDHLDGMFAFAVYDTGRRRLLICRDRAGMKPLYWTRDGSTGAFVFASEIRALLASGLVEARVDPDGLAATLAVGWVPAPMTGFAGIAKLPTGGRLVLERGRVREDRYWWLQYDPRDGVSEAQWEEELDATLTAVVGSHMAADVPVGAFLSGGLDSSLIATLAAAGSAAPLKTFSIVFPDDPMVDESRHSRLVAESIGAEHHEIEYRASQLSRLLPRVIEAIEEPYAAAPTAVIHQLAGLAGGHVKTVVGGEGSDEIFGGYPWDHKPWPERLRWCLPRWVGRVAEGHMPRNWMRNLCRKIAAPDGPAADVEEFRRMTGGSMRQLVNAPYLSGADEVSAIRLPEPTADTCRNAFQRQVALDYLGRLADGITISNDKLGMAHSLEIRTPYLDRSMVELACRMPDSLKRRPGREKYLLWKLGSRCLPEAIARRRKFGLQYPRMIRANRGYIAYVREVLLDSAAGGDGLYRREPLERLLDRWCRPDAYEPRALYPLLVTQLWWNRFFAGSSARPVSARPRATPVPVGV